MRKEADKMPVIDLNKIKTENHWTNRVKRFGKAALEKGKDLVDYVKEDPKRAIEIAGLVTAVTGGASKVVRTVNRNKELRQEKFHREREVYDRSLGMYVVTKRKLTKADLDKVNEIRRKTGKRTTEVLSDLNLLKK